MMMSLARQLPQCQDTHAGIAWLLAERRMNCHLLVGQTAVILSFGAIGAVVCGMVSPFRMKLIAVRREVRGDEPIETVTEKEIARVLPRADHVINILPGGEATRHLIDAEKFAR